MAKKFPKSKSAKKYSRIESKLKSSGRLVGNKMTLKEYLKKAEDDNNP